MPSSGFKKCARSEEHTSELQSHDNLVCRLLLEKKKYYYRSGGEQAFTQASTHVLAPPPGAGVAVSPTLSTRPYCDDTPVARLLRWRGRLRPPRPQEQAQLRKRRSPGH